MKNFKPISFRSLNQLESLQDSIETCDSILNNPAAFYGDDEEWEQIKREKDYSEKYQNKILKRLGFDRLQTVVDTYRVAIATKDFKTADYVLPILDACNVRFGINTIL